MTEQNLDKVRKYLDDFRSKPQIIDPRRVFHPCPIELVEAYYKARVYYDRLASLCLDIASRHLNGNVSKYSLIEGGQVKKSFSNLGSIKDVPRKNGISSTRPEET